jgi:hypothetical protein
MNTMCGFQISHMVHDKNIKKQIFNLKRNMAKRFFYDVMGYNSKKYISYSQKPTKG